MLKIATMICIFKMMEKDPTFKEKQIFLSSNLPLGVSVHPPHPLRAGQSYSVRQLLQAMIEFSDNDATGLLFKEVNQADYAGLFTDLGIEVPEIYGWDYTITASDYARFYRVLYNASYLNRASSEMALTLLTQTTFKNGMVKNFPANVIVAHKFGERMTEVKSLQFHDAGIVYVGNRPYVAVFMTEGMNIDVLPDAIAQLSSICYDYAIAQK